jgi:hypothetical protein
MIAVASYLSIYLFVSNHISRLGTLFHSISRSEIRYLQERLSEPAFSMKKDFGTLPTELLINIVNYLDLEDFLRIRAVSHRWIEAFSIPEICSRITKTYFRPHWDNLISDNGSYVTANWVTQAAIKRLRRINGRHRVVSFKSLTGPPRSNPFSIIKRPQYYCGKVAWNYDDRTIAIRDLQTEVEVLHREENREMMSKWLLSDQFLIVTKASL